MPLTPLMILWVNLVSDGIPALALGFEQAEDGIMQRKPRTRDEDIFDARTSTRLCRKSPFDNTKLLMAVGLSMGLSAAAVYTPAGHFVLRTSSLPFNLLLGCAFVASLPALLLSGVKKGVFGGDGGSLEIATRGGGGRLYEDSMSLSGMDQ